MHRQTRPATTSTARRRRSHTSSATARRPRLVLTQASAAPPPPLPPPAETRRRRVAVVGAGVLGLASALRLQQSHPSWRVVVLADAFEDETTTAGAAGVWGPYKLSQTPESDVIRWSRETYSHLLAVAHSAEADDAGVSRLRAVTLRTAPRTATAPSSLPYWAEAVGGPDAFSRVSAQELALFSSGFARAAAEGLPPLPAQLCRFADGEDDEREKELACGTAPLGPDPHAAPFVEGFTWPTAVCEGGPYLRWLTRKLRAAGGSVRKCRVRDVAALANGKERVPPPPPEEEEKGAEENRDEDEQSLPFDAVVDACGLCAPVLFPEDAEQVYPIRGHVLRVRAPWLREALFAESGHNGGTGVYILPNRDFVVIGGTGQVGDGDREPRADERAAVLRAALALAPSLWRAEPVGEWVGLRPGRTRARVGETEWLQGARGGSSFGAVPCVHCYGHGGSGLTLAWGCAGDVVEAVERALDGSKKGGGE